MVIGVHVAPAYPPVRPANRGNENDPELEYVMNRADEGALAWALADSATTFLSSIDHAWLCTKIGVGEWDSAIRDLLVFYANTDAELPCELAAQIRAWIQGYSGSDSEPILRHIYDQISVSVTNTANSQRPEDAHRSPRRLIARRSARAVHTPEPRPGARHTP